MIENTETVSMESILKALTEREENFKKELAPVVEKINNLRPHYISMSKYSGEPYNFPRTQEQKDYARSHYQFQEIKKEYEPYPKNFSYICSQYEATILLTYIYLLKLPTTTLEDLENLSKRFAQFINSLNSQEKFQSGGVMTTLFDRIQLNSYNFPYVCLDDQGQNIFSAFFNSIKEKQNEFSAEIVSANSYNRKIVLTLRMITQLYSLFPSEQQVKVSAEQHATVESLFKEQSLITRIYWVTILDNLRLFKAFLDEYKQYHPQEDLTDFVTNYALAGLAAANGCIKVMQFLIQEKLVNIDQRFTLTLNGQQTTSCHPKSKLYSQKAYPHNIDISLLGLFLSAAPVLKKEQVCNMLEIFLKAGANYQDEVIETWIEQGGHVNYPYFHNKNVRTKLLQYDSTGSLRLMVDKLKEEKAPQGKKSHKKSDTEASKLHEKIQLLQKKVELLEKEITQVKLENAKQEDGYKTIIANLEKELESWKNKPKQKDYSKNLKHITSMQSARRGFLQRKKEPIDKLKEQRKQEILSQSEAAISRLTKEGKFQMVAELASAIDKKNWYVAWRIMHNRPEQELQIKPDLKIKY